jgi:hypothetical protein
MPTKVFISWSGPLSQKLGEALRNWLPSTLQFVKPYFSLEDIEKGAKWGPEISGELATSNIGIICLTRDNTEKPWLLFEAGALSKSLEKGLVCTLLFGLEPADIKGPLTQFAVKFRWSSSPSRLAGVIETAKFKTATRSGYRLSAVGAAPRGCAASRNLSQARSPLSQAWKETITARRNGPEKGDRMEPSRIESALALARWALRCFFISTPGAID